MTNPKLQPADFFLLSGLVNGAQGTVVGILYRDGKQPPDIPDAVLVQFDNYVGKHCL